MLEDGVWEDADADTEEQEAVELAMLVMKVLIMVTMASSDSVEEEATTFATAATLDSAADAVVEVTAAAGEVVAPPEPHVATSPPGAV